MESEGSLSRLQARQMVLILTQMNPVQNLLPYFSN